jgi:hypothetical protein
VIPPTKTKNAAAPGSAPQKTALASASRPRACSIAIRVAEALGDWTLDGMG